MEGMKLFERWDTSGVAVGDLGLRRYVNTKPLIVPRTNGKYKSQIDKDKMNIVERLINKLMIPGHKGKKHKMTSGRCTASTQEIIKAVIKAFDDIEKKTKKNPVQVLVTAIENSALLEEIASYRMGGIIARQAVVATPHRRLDLALRHISQGIYSSCFNKKQKLWQAISEELIAGANNDQKSAGVRERVRIEKEAEGAR